MENSGRFSVNIVARWANCLPLAIGALLSACATIDHAPAALPATPPAYRNVAQAEEDLPRPRSDWWREFSNPELDRLQDAALANNRDLRAAIARIAQAQAQARIAQGALLPTVDAFGKREASAPLDGPGTATSTKDWHNINNYQAGLRANYEIDVWGRTGFAAESALALAVASVYLRESVAVTLTADLAAAYFEYLSLGDRIAIANRGVQSRRRSLLAIEKRIAGGESAVGEAALQRVALATAESLAATLLQRRERAFNRLALLAGVAPSELRLEPRSLEGVAIPAINAGLPSELLCRRPDIRRVEAQLRSAQFDVRSLRANLLPSFSLTSEIGYGSRALVALTNPASLFYLAAGSFAQTLFDGDRKQAQVEAAQARQLEMLEQYSGVLLTALREVEDALAGTRLTGEQYAAQSESARAAKTLLEINRRSYEIGAADYLALLDAEQKMYLNEDQAGSALYDRVRATIDLYKALGGGTRSADLPGCPG